MRVFPQMSANPLGVEFGSSRRPGLPSLALPATVDTVSFQGVQPKPFFSGHLDGKVALVTGSSSGIGLGIATRLAKEGASVVMNGVEPVRAVAPAVKEIKRLTGAEVLYVRADLSKPGDVNQLVDKARKRFGKVDILVNNAGIQRVFPIEKFPLEEWNRMLAIHLTAPFLLMKALVPEMKERGWGRIINIGSAHSKTASVHKSAYVAAKHGVAGLGKVAAKELAESGITVNTVCPGYVDTPLVQKQIPEHMERRGMTREQVIRDVMLVNQHTKQFVGIDEVAGLVNFLCSDDAKSMTGNLESIDGGWTA
jgi:3-hydroxybutyrate dehydrogenase